MKEIVMTETTQPAPTLTTDEATRVAESLQRLGKMLEGVRHGAVFFNDIAAALNWRTELDRDIQQRRESLAALEDGARRATASITEVEQARLALANDQAAAAQKAVQIVEEAQTQAAAILADARQRGGAQAAQIIEQAQIGAGRIQRQAQETLQAAERTRADLEARMQSLQQQAANLLGSA
jgi:cell division septum initiation protein DivIVA